jgi:hypothetical protein
MKQSKKKLLVVLGIIAVVVTAGLAAYAFQPASAPDGQITVTAPNFNDTDLTARIAASKALGERLVYARARRAETDIDQGGSGAFWATQGVHNTFNAAIAAAEAVYSSAGIFSPGDEFDIAVNIAGNSGGFAGMYLRLQLPSRLEVVRITPGASFVTDPFHHNGHNHDFFNAGENWNRETFAVNPPATGGVVAGWAGRTSGNFTNNGTLVTFTVRVTPGATGIDVGPISIGFGTAQAPFGDRPVRVPGAGQESVPLEMSIQGQVIPIAGNDRSFIPVTLGSVRIVP